MITFTNKAAGEMKTRIANFKLQVPKSKFQDTGAKLARLNGCGQTGTTAADHDNVKIQLLRSHGGTVSPV